MLYYLVGQAALLPPLRKREGVASAPPSTRQMWQNTDNKEHLEDKTVLLSQSLGTCPHPDVGEQAHSQEAQGSLAQTEPTHQANEDETWTQQTMERDFARFSQDDTVPDHDMLWPPGRSG